MHILSNLSGVLFFRREGVKREAQDLIQELQTDINTVRETINELDKTTDLQVRPKL